MKRTALLSALLAMAFVRWSRHRIGFTRSFGPKRVFAGNTVRIEIAARNLGKLPAPPLILEDAASSAIGGRMMSQMVNNRSVSFQVVGPQARLLRTTRAEHSIRIVEVHCGADGRVVRRRTRSA